MIESKLYEGSGKLMAGYVNAGGVIRTINASNLSIVEVFLREAVQNSFDAKKEGFSNINFGMRAYNFSDDQFVNFKNLFDEGTALKPTFYRKHLASKIKKSMLNIEVTDTNTVGLTGYAGVTDKKDKKQHFSKFVYETGNDKGDDSNAGGSYGYGKAAFYSFSKLRTICIYSRIKLDNIVSNGKHKYQSRFIVVTTDERITDSLIDRCWWGRQETYLDNPATYAAPLLDDEADNVAISIGMKKFDEMETGTKLLILDAGVESPEIGDDEEEKTKSIDQIFVDDLPRYIVHWYWPKIVTEEIDFSLEYKGKRIPIDDPHEIYPYSEFISAFKDGRKRYSDKRIQEATGYKRVLFNKPVADLGYVSVKKSQVTVGRKCEYRDLFKDFENPIPSVAFMRGIGHIVFYKHYNFIDPSAIKDTCFGIFKVNGTSCTANGTSGEIDRYFRDIEDQTHERWVHKKEKKYNFLSRVEHDVEDIIKTTVSAEEIAENAVANLSVVIQRTLGSKLMLAPTSYGGAKKPLKDDAFSETTIAIKKSTFRATGRSTVSLDPKTSEKVVNLEYKATIKKDKALVIKSITPFVRDADGIKNETIDLIFQKINFEKKDRSGVTGIMYTKLPLRIDVSGEYSISILCKRNCAFTLDVEVEEE